MSPVIRLSDQIYERLSAHAIGFDTPSNVIERLLEFYDSHQKSLRNPTSIGAKVGSLVEVPVQHPSGTKKPRDIEREKTLKRAVGTALDWGNFRLSGSVLDFHDSQKKVLCKYSSYSPDQDRWFWGVSRKHWRQWDNHFHLALLMENKDHESYSVLILDPKDALNLFTKCSESGGEKKINLRFYKSDGMLRLQEWQEYDVKKHTLRIRTF